MRKKLIILQEDSKDCGCASLLSIIRYYGGNISYTKLQELTQTNKKGTNFYNLSIAANEIGLNSQSYKIENSESLFKIKCPFLCQILQKNIPHFIVVYKINQYYTTIMDPSSGTQKISLNEFLNLSTGNIMIFNPRQKLPIYKEQNYLKNLLIQTLLNNKKTIILICILSLFYGIITCFSSLILNIIIKYIINSYHLNNFIIIMLCLIFLTLIKVLFNYSRIESLIYLNKKIDLTLFTSTFYKILLLPYRYYKNKTTGDIISRLNDLITIKNLFNKIIFSLFFDTITFVLGLIILFILDKKIFCYFIMTIFLYLIILILFRPTIKKYISKNQINNAKINSYLVENIYGYETIKGLNIETNVMNKFTTHYNHSILENAYLEQTSNLESSLTELISSLGLILILYIGTRKIISHEISLGIFLTIESLIILLIDPLKNLLNISSDYYFSKNALLRANHLLLIDSETLEDNALSTIGNIDIHNLNFSFDGINNVLINLSLSINNQEKVLILGSSGSGKSTLLKILYKYYNINRKEIYINEHDFVDYKLGTIRKNISYISQNEYLFNDTVKNNILLDRQITEEEFTNVCNITHVDEFIEKLFLKYDTIIEENGVNFSGGQRQRIILARTLLKKSNIILIDEGLNEIDVDLERKILKNIFEIYKDQTIIIVSHRFENMDIYDRIVRLEKGQILENIKRQKD